MAARDGLELDQDLAFQRAEWRFQRFGWWALCGFVLAALLGLFGEGPLSHATAASGRLSVEYERFARLGRTATLRVRSTGQPLPGAVLYIDRAYFDHVRVGRITPEPEAISMSGDRVALRFGPDAVAGDAIVFDLEPVAWGIEAVALQLGDDEPVRFRQVVYF